MENKITIRFKKAWNAFFNKDPTRDYKYDYGPSYSYRPDRKRASYGNEKSLITPVINRIAMDVASIDILHVRLDEDGRFKEVIDDGLNNCLTVEANMDQTGRALIQDIAHSMCDEGVIAIVPVDTDKDPEEGSFDVLTMRVGSIREWKPSRVKIDVYNERDGQHREIWMDKSEVCIVQNPFYSIMNEPNSIGKRLMQKLNLLDQIDSQTGSGKLDLIIQLPYTLKTPYRQNQAEERKKKIEEQLAGSKYGIAYIDSTEHVTQLNRSLENNLQAQIEYLRDMYYSQLGITQEILNGTADEKTMLNYYNRSIEPIVSAIVDEMIRKWLTKTARSQNQSIKFFRDPFKLTPVSDLAEISDKLTRNEIATSNEIRSIIGWKPSNEPSADELRNKNLNQSKQAEVESVEQINKLKEETK